MRYEDQQLILEYCRLGLAIATAKNPGTKHDVSEADTLKRGYKLMRQRMEQLSPKKKAAFRAMLKGEVDGVKALVAAAKARGEEFTLADISVEMLDLETREVIPDRPNVTIETANDNKEQTDDESSDDSKADTSAQAGGTDDANPRSL